MFLNHVNLNKQRSTHMPMLIRTVQATSGPVLELGAGPYSTPLLHWLIAGSGRYLVTYDNVPLFYNYAKRFQSRDHIVYLTKDWREIDQDNTYWSVVFIDHSGKIRDDSRRGGDAIRLKDRADYIVLHDTDNEDTCGYIKMWPYFKYRFDWKYCKPWTSVVSNFIDVSKWK